MAKFRITSPEGKTFEINAPDGANQDDILSYAKTQFQNMPKNEAKVDTQARLNAIEPPNWLEQKLAQVPSSWLLSPKNESRVRGVLMGGADPVVGTTQLAMNAIGQGDKINHAIKAKEEEYQANRQAVGRDGLDWSRLLGNTAVTLPFGPKKVPQGLIDTLKQGVIYGGGVGASMPVTQGDYFPEKGSQVLTSALGGAVTAPVAAAIGNAGQFLNEKARSLMQSALKPTLAQRESGEAARAIQTLFDEGINATKGGVEKLQTRASNINNEIKNLISNSNKSIDKQSVINALRDTKNKFTNQVSPQGDLSAIGNIEEQFLNHPHFQDIASKGEPLLAELERATQGKTQALQAAGKLKTFAAQQENLAQGRPIPLSKNQSENQPYFNTGSNGGEALSSSAYPVSGFPRIPGKMSHNIGRVPEGESGFQDAMAAYAQRKADESIAQNAVDEWRNSLNKLPVQQAQALKQGTYRVLQGKFGETGSAATEAQKSLARGLKEQIAIQHPEISPLNARESDLINALGVTERRALLDENKNPLGLAPIAHNPIAAVGMLADRSALVKSLLARGLNSTSEANIPGGKALAEYLRNYSPQFAAPGGFFANSLTNGQ